MEKGKAKLLGKVAGHQVTFSGWFGVTADIERKPGALEVARPLEGWELPESFGLLRRRLEADHGSGGTKEYIAVLRLLEKHDLKRLKVAVGRALDLGCPRKELIEQYLYGENREALVFQLDGREHLKGVAVQVTDPADYRALLEREVAA